MTNHGEYFPAFEDEEEDEEEDETMYGDEPSWRAACRGDNGVRWGS